jgi:hypothetical protein
MENMAGNRSLQKVSKNSNLRYSSDENLDEAPGHERENLVGNPGKHALKV